MKTLSITFSIVVYNNEKTILSTIEGLISKIPNSIIYKLYIIDNCSTDGSIDMVIAKYKHNESVKFIFNNFNLGFGRAHNLVINMLESDYHVVVNPDIIINDNKFYEVLEDILKNNKTYGLIVPKILNVDGSVQMLCKHNPTILDLVLRFTSSPFLLERQKWFYMYNQYEYEHSVDYASGCFMIFKTEVFNNIGGFDARFFLHFEDADITRKVKQISNTLYYPKLVITHEWARDNRKKIKIIFITFVSMIKYFNKWGWKFI